MSDSMKKHGVFLELRDRYPEFVFHGFEHVVKDGRLAVRFRYSIPPDLQFESHLEIDLPAEQPLSDSQLETFLFPLGLVDLISYWKCTCSPRVRIDVGGLTAHQQAWWRNLFFQGLGEFRFVNGIDVSTDAFVNFECSKRPFPLVPTPGNQGSLVPVGGGKDSAVTLELLSHTDDVSCFLLNPLTAAWKSCEVAGFDRSRIITASRQIDPELLRCNDEGYLNGHTPFSALLAFLSITVAALQRKQYVVLSNEASANEGNTAEVNHQYSKTLDFERDFRNYLQEGINQDIGYFSFLRPLNELQIGWAFSQYPQHLSSFRSCNTGSKQGVWCGDCAKCLFVYIILSPFVTEEDLQNIFGKSLLDDPSMLELFWGLVDPVTVKPFECVGERAEVRAAIEFLLERGSARELPCLLAAYRERFGSAGKGHEGLEEFLSAQNEEHFVPDVFVPLVLGVIEDARRKVG